MDRAPWSDWTLVHLLRRQAAEQGDRPFVRFEDGQSFTFRASSMPGPMSWPHRWPRSG